MKETYIVYMLECADATLYVGYTTDLSRRLLEHNDSKKGARYTRGRRPVTLRHSENYKTLSEALKRECELKTWTRAQKLALCTRGG